MSTVSTPSTGLFGWLQQASTMQRRVLLAASLGWMLDSMDVMLYALVVPSVRTDLHLTAAEAGLIMSATLICAAIGGMLFGVAADRFGRTRALIASILVYCVCTGLCGLVQTALQLAICRMLLGFGMGGEWAAGAALVAETWPDEHRGKALAFMQSSWAIGYACGAAIVAVVMPHYGWRGVFFAGLLPAIFTIWIRRRVREPERWTETKATHSYAIAKFFRGRNGRHLAIVTVVNAATLFAWWGLFFWVPSYLSLPTSQGGRGLSIVQTSAWTILMQAGTFLGYISYGFLADRLGRKVADLVMTPGPARDRLTLGVYRAIEPGNPLGLLQQALLLTPQAELIEKKIRVEGVKTGRITSLDLPHQIEEALALGIISAEEAAFLSDYDAKVMNLINVDEFTSAELAQQPA